MRLAQHKLPIATKFITRHESAVQLLAHTLTMDEPEGEYEEADFFEVEAE